MKVRIEVFLENDYDRCFEVIELTEEELRQFACNKAEQKYTTEHWTKIQADGLVSIEMEK